MHPGRPPPCSATRPTGAAAPPDQLLAVPRTDPASPASLPAAPRRSPQPQASWASAPLLVPAGHGALPGMACRSLGCRPIGASPNESCRALFVASPPAVQLANHSRAAVATRGPRRPRRHQQRPRGGERAKLRRQCVTRARREIAEVAEPPVAVPALLGDAEQRRDQPNRQHLLERASALGVGSVGRLDVRRRRCRRRRLVQNRPL